MRSKLPHKALQQWPRDPRPVTGLVRLARAPEDHEIPTKGPQGKGYHTPRTEAQDKSRSVPKHPRMAAACYESRRFLTAAGPAAERLPSAARCGALPTAMLRPTIITMPLSPLMLTSALSGLRRSETGQVPQASRARSVVGVIRSCRRNQRLRAPEPLVSPSLTTFMRRISERLEPD